MKFTILILLPLKGCAFSKAGVFPSSTHPWFAPQGMDLELEILRPETIEVEPPETIEVERLPRSEHSMGVGCGGGCCGSGRGSRASACLQPEEL